MLKPADVSAALVTISKAIAEAMEAKQQVYAED
jgi:hypothetical protein